MQTSLTPDKLRHLGQVFPGFSQVVLASLNDFIALSCPRIESGNLIRELDMSAPDGMVELSPRQRSFKQITVIGAETIVRPARQPAGMPRKMVGSVTGWRTPWVVPVNHPACHRVRFMPAVNGRDPYFMDLVTESPLVKADLVHLQGYDDRIGCAMYAILDLSQL